MVSLIANMDDNSALRMRTAMMLVSIVLAFGSSEKILATHFRNITANPSD